jgi:hypothetical protein
VALYLAILGRDAATTQFEGHSTVGGRQRPVPRFESTWRHPLVPVRGFRAQGDPWFVSYSLMADAACGPDPDIEFLGRSRQEAGPKLAAVHEFDDAYWKAKRVDFSRIKVPSYILGSYSSMLHTMGSVRAWREINNDKKWFRIHPHQEWYEDYHYRSIDDLDRFFARFLKGEDNDWELTPKVRVSLYRYGDKVR